ncbi:Anaphase-promoting complex subunit 7 [Entophlyctis luteolus]|nr:Anaphase-promoting complex subunit 7 [Entophlyctis luteolus]
MSSVIGSIPSIHRPWLVPWLEAYKSSLDCNFNDALAKLNSVQRHLSADNVPLLLDLAELHLRSGNFVLAHYAFDQVRRLDPTNPSRMAQYARVLQKQGTLMQLNKLASEMLRDMDAGNGSDSCAAEAWFVVSRYCEAKKDFEKALLFCGKGLKIDRNHVEGNLLKGSLHLAIKDPQGSLAPFKLAHAACPSLESYRGLVDAYIASHRLREALAVAREAGQAAFEKALELDPSCPDALFSLASSLIADSKHAQASELMQSAVAGLTHTTRAIRFAAPAAGAGKGSKGPGVPAICANNNTPAVHARLGDIYSVLKDFDRALEHYNVALRGDAACDAARIGIERVEKLIARGDASVDGDVDEDDEEDEDGNGDEDANADDGEGMIEDEDDL